MLYHRDVFFPRFSFMPKGSFKLTYTQHARLAGNTDRYKKIILPPRIDTSLATAIEVQTDHCYNPTKILYRIPYIQDRKFDLLIAVLVPSFVVKTVWLNSAEDLHSTLNSRVYACI